VVEANGSLQYFDFYLAPLKYIGIIIINATMTISPDCLKTRQTFFDGLVRGSEQSRVSVTLLIATTKKLKLKIGILNIGKIK